MNCIVTNEKSQDLDLANIVEFTVWALALPSRKVITTFSIPVAS